MAKQKASKRQAKGKQVASLLLKQNASPVPVPVPTTKDRAKDVHHPSVCTDEIPTDDATNIGVGGVA